MDVGVGKPTTKLHTIMDGEYKQISAKWDQEKKGVRERKGLYNKQEQILNIYNQ